MRIKQTILVIEDEEKHRRVIGLHLPREDMTSRRSARPRKD